jgi:hypothetical protein
MWMFTTTGFYSVVQHHQDPDTLVVRARAKEDLENLFRWTDAKLKIESLEATDYEFRIFMPRSQWEHIVARMINNLDYGNFKDEVAILQGKERAAVYARVWGVLLALQKRPPWGVLTPTKGKS